MDAVFYSILSFLSGCNYGRLIGPMEAVRESVCVCERPNSVSVLMYVGEVVHDLS